jgi:hypothetical protein
MINWYAEHRKLFAGTAVGAGAASGVYEKLTVPSILDKLPIKTFYGIHYSTEAALIQGAIVAGCGIAAVVVLEVAYRIMDRWGRLEVPRPNTYYIRRFLKDLKGMKNNVNERRDLIAGLRKGDAERACEILASFKDNKRIGRLPSYKDAMQSAEAWKDARLAAKSEAELKKQPDAGKPIDFTGLRDRLQAVLAGREAYEVLAEMVKRPEYGSISDAARAEVLKQFDEKVWKAQIPGMSRKMLNDLKKALAEAAPAGPNIGELLSKLDKGELNGLKEIWQALEVLILDKNNFAFLTADHGERIKKIYEQRKADLENASDLPGFAGEKFDAIEKALGIGEEEHKEEGPVEVDEGGTGGGGGGAPSAGEPEGETDPLGKTRFSTPDLGAGPFGPRPGGGGAAGAAGKKPPLPPPGSYKRFMLDGELTVAESLLGKAAAKGDAVAQRTLQRLKELSERVAQTIKNVGELVRANKWEDAIRLAETVLPALSNNKQKKYREYIELLKAKKEEVVRRIDEEVVEGMKAGDIAVASAEDAEQTIINLDIVVEEITRQAEPELLVGVDEAQKTVIDTDFLSNPGAQLSAALSAFIDLLPFPYRKNFEDYRKAGKLRLIYGLIAMEEQLRILGVNRTNADLNRAYAALWSELDARFGDEA